MQFQNCLLKEYIFKIAPTKISFLKFPLKKTKQRKTKMKLLPQKRHFQNCSLKKFF